MCKRLCRTIYTTSALTDTNSFRDNNMNHFFVFFMRTCAIKNLNYKHK